MMGRHWFKLFYCVLGAGLSLWTGDWWWLAWAVPIALVLTIALVLSGHSREFTVRRRLRQIAELADRIGAREGEVVSEHRQRDGVIGIDPRLDVVTVREGTEGDFREKLIRAAASAGYHPRPNGIFDSVAGPLYILVQTAVGRSFECDIPEGKVRVMIMIGTRR
ncbi:hypothetical protein AB5J62_17135 [Amycolatopsis sp. cg5]|uniref:hypothetical protein n=1 Tax=Amycolatopsis sp. cg5 TaxID=3238802 RepID=UPI003523B3B5